MQLVTDQHLQLSDEQKGAGGICHEFVELVVVVVRDGRPVVKRDPALERGDLARRVRSGKGESARGSPVWSTHEQKEMRRAD